MKKAWAQTYYICVLLQVSTKILSFLFYRLRIDNNLSLNNDQIIQGRCQPMASFDGNHRQRNFQIFSSFGILIGIILNSNKFGKIIDELCKVLRCHEDEVCLVKHNSAVCFPKTKLQFDDDFRSHRKSKQAINVKTFRPAFRFIANIFPLSFSRKKRKIVA